MELLRRGDEGGLERLVVAEPRAVQPLLGRLWDREPAIAARAARALGAAAAAHPELGRELLRRALWALNDESATNDAAMLPAFAEIACRAPEIAAPFVAPMGSYLWDDGLRPGILRALSRIEESGVDLSSEVRDQLAALQNPRAWLYRVATNLAHLAFQLRDRRHCCLQGLGGVVGRSQNLCRLAAGLDEFRAQRPQRGTGLAQRLAHHVAPLGRQEGRNPVRVGEDGLGDVAEEPGVLHRVAGVADGVVGDHHAPRAGVAILMN